MLVAEAVVGGLSSPIALTAPAGSGRLYIAEQVGRIRVFESDSLRATPFLDIRSIVQSGGERGLLGFAFHPNFATNRFVYVNYTDQGGATRVVRFTATDDLHADAATAKDILTVAQPFGNHNGGATLFGPDGMLYVALGDGGSGGDPQGHGQNAQTLLGSILRIDVDAGDPYAIPPDNPFVGRTDGRLEIWAFGLRNPWRFSFDTLTDQVLIGDVGQNRFEEIDMVARGAGPYNFGWNVMEGASCFGSATCNMSGLTQPVLAYDHTDGCSVIGGHVYRGSAIPGLTGHYFYSDYCGGWLRSALIGTGTFGVSINWPLGDLGNILSFGEDAAGELYLLSANGTVYRITEGQ